jgi:hypothetical protein
MLCNLVDGLNSFGAEMLEAAGMGKDEAQNIITQVDEQYRDSKWELSMNMYIPCKVVNGRMYCAVRKVVS